MLSGTYPNPGFAVDMVEQSELTAALGTKADLVGGTVPDAQIPATITRDSELAAAIAAETTARIADVNAEETARIAADSTKQPLDSDLTTLAALDSSQSGVIASDGAGWLRKTYAQLKTALGLVKADVGLGNVDNVRGIVPIPFVAGHYLQSMLGNAVLTSSQNALVLAPMFLESDVTIDRIAVEVTTAAASSFVRPAIYGSDANGRPGALLVDGGQLDASTPGIKEAAVNVTIPRGISWWGSINQGGVPTTRQGTVWAGGRPMLLGPSPTTFNAAFPAQLSISAALPSPMVPNAGSTNVTAVRVRIA